MQTGPWCCISVLRDLYALSCAVLTTKLFMCQSTGNCPLLLRDQRQAMGTSRDNSAHHIFPIELSQHGLDRVMSASSPKEAIQSASQDVHEQLRQHVRLLCAPASAFERQVWLLLQWHGR